MHFDFLQTYQDWRFCIEKSCRIELTKNFVESRLQELANLNNESTQRFIQRYGSNHHKQITLWFRQAMTELK